MTTLSVRDLEITRGQAEQTFTVRLPDLELHAGKPIAITGPSGCGKSTLVEALGLILRPNSLGRFWLLDQDITTMVNGQPDKADGALSMLRARHYGFVPQSNGLLPFLTVKQNVELQARIIGQRITTSWLKKVTKDLGLEGLLDRLPKDLSIGQRQRVSFLRAIAHQPQVLLADEPTAALDPINATSLFKVMLELAADIGIATVVVTHEWHLVEMFKIDRLAAVQIDDKCMEFTPCIE